MCCIGDYDGDGDEGLNIARAICGFVSVQREEKGSRVNSMCREVMVLFSFICSGYLWSAKLREESTQTPTDLEGIDFLLQLFEWEWKRSFEYIKVTASLVTSSKEVLG